MHAGAIVEAALLERLIALTATQLAQGRSPRDAQRRALRSLRAEGSVVVLVL